MNLQQILDRQAAIRARLVEIETTTDPEGDAERAALTTETDGLLAEWDTLEAERQPIAERAARLAAVRAHIPTQRAGNGRVERSGGPEVIVRADPFAALEDRSLRGRDLSRALTDGLLRANEDRIDDGGNQSHFERLIKRHAGTEYGHRWAANLLGRSRPEYASGFAKLLSGSPHLLDEAERAAVAIGTSTQGGALVPTALDPTLILTNDGSSNVMRQHASVRTLIDGNVWYGVTSAGSTASWDAELAEVSDDSPSVASASITCYKAQNFIQSSVEAVQDIAGLASDVLMLFADARDRLEGAAHMTGSGSAPQGLFTLVCASTTLRTTSTTAATIGEVDLHSLYKALPVRWRNRASFVAHPLYTLAVKRLGTAVSSSYQGDFTQPVAERWLGRPVVETDDAPTTQTTTALDQEIVFADLSQYIVVDKPGSFSIQYVPTLFNTANNLPDGRVGWYSYWRTGAGMPALAAGRWLADKTSA